MLKNCLVSQTPHGTFQVLNRFCGQLSTFFNCAFPFWRVDLNPYKNLCKKYETFSIHRLLRHVCLFLACTTCTAFSQDLRLDHVTRDALAARNNNEAQELVEEQGNLGADHFTLQAGVDDFEKKIPASACRKKKIACSTNVIEKISCPPDC